MSEYFWKKKCISGQKIAVKNGLELILRTPDLAELLQIKKELISIIRAA
jgi:hypothetical protein